MRYVPEWEAEQDYRNMLDEIYGTVSIAGMEYETSRALEELDNTAFRGGFLDWCDNEGITTDASEADGEED